MYLRFSSTLILKFDFLLSVIPVYYRGLRMEKQIAQRKNWPGIGFAPVMVMLSLLVAGGCVSNQPISMPPLSPVPTERHQLGKFVWFELLTENVQAAQNFYGELFGWHFKGKPSDYMVIYSGDKPIGGMFPYENKDPRVLESFWMCLLSVDNVDRALAEVKALDGEVLDGPMDVEGRGRMAVIRDPQGAELTLIRTAGGDPVNEGVKAGEFLWVDLFTRDPDKANAFYGAIAGYTARTVKTDNDHAYHLLDIGNHAYAGVVKLPWEDVEPNWLPYIKVENLDGTMAKAEKLRGVVILRLKNIALIADPTGGVFGIQMIREEN